MIALANSGSAGISQRYALTSDMAGLLAVFGFVAGRHQVRHGFQLLRGAGSGSSSSVGSRSASRRSCQRLTSSVPRCLIEHEDQRQGDGRLARRHREDEQDERLPLEIAAIPREGDEVDRHALQHHLGTTGT